MVSNSRSPTPCLQHLVLSFCYQMWLKLLRSCVGKGGLVQCKDRGDFCAALHLGGTGCGSWSSALGSLLCSLTPKPGVLAGTFNLQCIIVKGQNHLTSSEAGERALFVVCYLMAGWLLPCSYYSLQENPRLL